MNGVWHEGGIYFRRLAADDRYQLFWRFRRRARYEVWHPNREPTRVTRRELDRLLDGRRFPADCWGAVNAADEAFVSGDRLSWIESVTGGRTTSPHSSSPRPPAAR